jgi:hypothetical protein
MKRLIERLIERIVDLVFLTDDQVSFRRKLIVFLLGAAMLLVLFSR